jgi:rhomboid family GlyGly-CTERM serine protease
MIGMICKSTADCSCPRTASGSCQGTVSGSYDAAPQVPASNGVAAGLVPRAVLPEFILFLILLVTFNYSLVTGGYCESMIFLSEKVMRGELWRIASHPFVHLSWYHLLLDAGAFWLLYGRLNESRRMRRLAHVTACGAGSLLFAILCSPTVAASGLCGLSGIAHGLMAVSALESMKDARRNSDTAQYRVGLTMLLVVAGKSILEVISGHVLFESLHLGLMGSPVPEAHAGGVLSGIIAYTMIRETPHQNLLEADISDTERSSFTQGSTHGN